MLDFSEKGNLTLGEFIEREEIASIDLKFCDLAGHWHHKTLPADGSIDEVFGHIIGVDGSSIPQFAAVNKGDIAIVPDLSTGFIDETFDRPCLSFICDAANTDDLTPHLMDPRGVAKRAMAYLKGFGAVDEILILPELEYYTFDKVDYHVSEDEAYWSIISAEGNPAKLEDEIFDCDCERGSVFKIPAGQGYTIAAPMDAYVNMRDDIMEKLQFIGIEVKNHHHEGGAFGQQEFEFKRAGLLATADNILLGKYITRMTATEFRLLVTFMPKPLPHKPGNGMHFHMQLRKNGKPVNYSEDGDANLSPVALSFIAGILSHGRALMAITSASTNSYRRLKPGFETPTSFFFSVGNREAAIRIPAYAKDPEEKRWEYRASDATGNPYLSLAALLMAGLDGIERNLDPKKLGFGPFEGPGPMLKRTPRNLGKLLPSSFEEALLALDADHDFLLKGDVFSEELVNAYIEYKYDQDIRVLQNHPHPYEFDMYFNL